MRPPSALSEKALRCRCYAYGRGAEWQAICIDFDIAVHGSSSEEAKRSLGVGIGLFFESVADLPSRDRRRQLRRKSPWRVRFWLAAGAFSSRWVAHVRRHSGVEEFEHQLGLQAIWPGLVFRCLGSAWAASGFRWRLVAAPWRACLGYRGAFRNLCGTRFRDAGSGLPPSAIGGPP